MLGDFAVGSSVQLKFNTHRATGEPITLGGTPAVAVYKQGSTVESTVGATLIVDYDGRTGLHNVVVNTAADAVFYSAGADFDIVLTAGTVDGVSVAGRRLATFSLANRSALRPTVHGRTLDVSVDGVADANTVTINGESVGSSTDPVNSTVIGLSSAGVTALQQAVWNALKSAHTTAGSFGEHLDAKVSSAGSGGLDAAGVRAAVGLTSPDLNTQLVAIKSDTAAAVTQTNPSATRAAVGLASANLDTQLSGILASAGAPGLTQADVRAAVGLASANLDTQLSGIGTQATSAASQTTAGVLRGVVGLASANLDTQLSGILAAADADVLDGASLRTALGLSSGTDLPDRLAAIKSDTAAIADRTGTSGVVVAAGSRSGYSLAATGLDAIATGDPGGVANMDTLPRMIVALWRRFYKKSTQDAGSFRTFGDNGTTVNTTQTTSDNGTVQTVEAAA